MTKVVTRKSCTICINYIGKNTSYSSKSKGNYQYDNYKFCKYKNTQIHSTANALICMYFICKDERLLTDPKIPSARRKSCRNCINLTEDYDHSRNSIIYKCSYSNDILSISSKRYCSSFKKK